MSEPLSDSTLGPNSPSKLVGTAWRLWTGNLWDLAKIQAVFVLPFVVLDLLLVLVMSEEIIEIAGRPIAFFSTQAELNRATVYSAITAFASAFAGLIAIGAGVWLLSRRSTDPIDPGPVLWSEALGAAWSRFGTLLVVTVLIFLGVGIGFLLLIIPGIYIGVAWWVSQAAVMIEDKSATQALGRSFRLVSGYWWHTFGTALLGVLLIIGLGAAMGLAVGIVIVALSGLEPELQFILDALLRSVPQILLAPFTASLMVALYYDLRGRKPSQADPGESIQPQGL